MALGHLNDFMKFDFVGFFTGKKFEVTAVRSWDEYKDGEKTGNNLGVRLDCVITEDKTVYNLKSDETFNNRYRTVTFKIEKKTYDDLIAKKSYLPVNEGDVIGNFPGCYCPHIIKCTPYGNNGFLNNLSIVVDGFEKVK